MMQRTLQFSDVVCYRKNLVKCNACAVARKIETDYFSRNVPISKDPVVRISRNSSYVSRIECSYKFCKIYDFSLNSTRDTKIRCLNDFSVRCAKIYDFMLIDQQAPVCGFYKIYKLYDFSLPSQFFNTSL